MFRCDNCNKQSMPSEKPVKRVVETRSQSYVTPVYEDGKIKVDKKTKEIIYKTTHGSEIVKEISVCGDCNE